MSGTPERVWRVEYDGILVCWTAVIESVIMHKKEGCDVTPYVPEAPKVEGLPTQEGWYCFIEFPGAAEFYHEVCRADGKDKFLFIWHKGIRLRIKNIHTEESTWYGPLQPPEEK